MIWPNGPPRRLKNLNSHFNQDHEPFVHFEIAKSSFFGVFITKHRIGLYRIKPFVPTFIHTDNDAIFSSVCISPTGKYVAAISRGKIHVFMVTPLDSFNRVLEPRGTAIRDIGPGEALGIRELTLESVKVVECPEDIVSLCALKNYFFIVSPQSIQFSPWGEPELQLVDTMGSILDAFTIAKVSYSSLISRFCFISDNGEVLVLHLTTDGLKTIEIPQNSSLPEPLATSFNPRLGKLAVVYENQMLLYNVKNLNDPPTIVPLTERIEHINDLEWAPTGKALLVAHLQGWLLVSPLGNLLYSGKTDPILHCKWSMASDEIVLLSKDYEVVIYEVTRAFMSHNQLFGAAAVLYSANRVQVYVDRYKKVFPVNPWQTVPVPNSYLGMNWPVTSAAVSKLGGFVALSGAYGLVYMSTVEHQWKVFTDPDIMVRPNGIQWYSNWLVLSVLTDSNIRRIEVYATAVSGARVTDNEEELLSSVEFEANIQAYAVSEKHELLVVLHNGTLSKYTIEENSLEPVSDYDLSALFKNHGTVSSMAIVNEDTILILMEDQLIQATKQENGYLTHTIHAPVEFFYVKKDSIWLFDGTQMIIVELNDLKKTGIELDGYPVCIDNTKGLVCTTNAFEHTASNGTYGYIQPNMEFQVYVPRLFDSSDAGALSLVSDYGRLEYFDDIMESVLYKTLVGPAYKMSDVVTTIKSHCKWTAVLARCARKSETKYWEKLFEEFGAQPEILFARALDSNDLDTAAEYLTILQAQFKADPGDGNMVQLYKRAYEAENFDICKQLGEFLLAIDGNGQLLEQFTKALDIY